MPSHPSHLTFAMPVLNGARTLDRTLESLQKQSLTSIRVVIIDNDSEDDTARICQDYVGRDSRFKYFRGERVDRNSNFARALEHVETEFVNWAAHDDVWHEDYSRKILHELESGYSVTLANWWIGDLTTMKGRQDFRNPLWHLRGLDSIERLLTYLNLPLRSHKANIVYSGFHLEFLRRCQNEQSMLDDGAFSANVVFSSELSILDEVLFFKHFPHEGWRNSLHAGLFRVSGGHFPRSTSRLFREARQRTFTNLVQLWPQWGDIIEEILEGLPLFSVQSNAVSSERLEELISRARARVG